MQSCNILSLQITHRSDTIAAANKVMLIQLPSACLFLFPNSNKEFLILTFLRWHSSNWRNTGFHISYNSNKKKNTAGFLPSSFPETPQQREKEITYKILKYHCLKAKVHYTINKHVHSRRQTFQKQSPEYIQNNVTAW